MAEDGIAGFRAWVKSLGMPMTLTELGCDPKDIPTLAANLRLGENKLGSFLPLTEKDVEKILASAI